MADGELFAFLVVGITLGGGNALRMRPIMKVERVLYRLFLVLGCYVQHV